MTSKRIQSLWLIYCHITSPPHFIVCTIQNRSETIFSKQALKYFLLSRYNSTAVTFHKATNIQQTIKATHFPWVISIPLVHKRWYETSPHFSALGDCGRSVGNSSAPLGGLTWDFLFALLIVSSSLCLNVSGTKPSASATRTSHMGPVMRNTVNRERILHYTFYYKNALSIECKCHSGTSVYQLQRCVE